VSIAFGELKTRVSTVLLDPSRKTFTLGLVEELINRALVEIGRIVPEQFSEDLTPVASQMTYQPRSNEFGVVQYAVTGVASTDLFTSAGHGLAAGDAIRFAALVGGTGLSTTTTYYVIATGLTVDVFAVSTSVGGASVNFTTDLTSATWYHYGSGTAVPDIDVRRVEVWDPTQDPEKFIARIPPASQQPVAGQDAGWYVWNGTLYLPTRFISALIGFESKYVIRIWGYSPYAPPEVDNDIISIGDEALNALIMYIHLDALRMLLNDRNLFTQWQTRSGNVDTSLAGLANEKNIAASEWRTYSRSIARLRSDI
jgi:hypothetical protein